MGMMNFEIRPQTAQFELGISDGEQLREWMAKTHLVPKLVFSGRSNVGKSSLINSIYGNKTARTSKTAGRTREVNVFSFPLYYDGKRATDLPLFYFLDIPGYGFAEVNPQMKKKWDFLMGVLFSEMTESTLIVNIQDARHPMQEADMAFRDFSKKLEANHILVFNKMDKLKTQKERAQLDKQRIEFSKKFKHCREIYFASAETAKGIPELTNSLIQFLLKTLEKRKVSHS
ncbi:MAG: ribosome biogenesis GTP-binding protein YsxC [Bdellovibrio sp. CG12_big_fil_rev_8_21_14_0_65_39_13]|nr:MAG: ribosome biogenesis GTP-binding protein YsxC [Bdellovibrio sp. CG22_combo_CG10-13_8_21_14_all_39_27]PIQ58772.1 MAG: ribosome biogenesis GTP-binding protein YsxC [Bdellovibrio sp. CG12_big_fil_rev_8_21_14_0_65_39_13]PIR35547.1 MAG: ribosome biogenesis GTP-binding protein YsxC [Bdellovibrio sp. CG11_big_fil_rev_8_21_14_0_20_39_38]